MMMNKKYVIKKLTHTKRGHMLHHNSVFSSDGQWIVFDGRNDETKIGETSFIGLVNVHTAEEQIIYHIPDATIYGPGVGAASFSSHRDTIVFIHGLYDANQQKPYDISRRFGLAISLQEPQQPFHMDARDVQYPYTAGSLRGGTHSHCWSPDGSMLSFTYNDEFVDSDLRMVGLMIPSDKPIEVPRIAGNNNGTKYAVIVSSVVRNPQWGSNEISKAFDECWIPGAIPRIAFQGNTLNDDGQLITEIYTVDVDIEKIMADPDAVGRIGELPQVPKGIVQKRLSYTEKGVSPLRHWLRANTDGKFIYALALDQKANNQIVQCEVETGMYKYISDLPFSISSPINLDKAGMRITFVADNNVFLYHVLDQKVENVTMDSFINDKIIGVPVFSPDDASLAFNVLETKDSSVQIYLVAI